MAPGLHALITSLLALALALLLVRDHVPRSTLRRLHSIDVAAYPPLAVTPHTAADMGRLDYSHTPSPATAKPRVLLVNDDGPPAKNSPHVLGLYDELCAQGWDVNVVLPSSQKSWGSMQFSLAGPVSFWYYYPIKDNFDGSHPDTAKSWSATRRPIDRARGEYAEWILVDGSPTTAANSGLFNQDAFYGKTAEEMAASPSSNSTTFDLVVSGPNFGRNTGTAFALSSGTLGAAQAASLSGVRSIAVSYGHFMMNPPTPTDRAAAKGPGLDVATLASVRDTAHRLSAKLITTLWSNWSSEPSVGCYSINVPLATTLSSPDVFWTRIWENRYGPLFASALSSSVAEGNGEGGWLPPSAPRPEHAIHFAPQMGALLRPRSLEVGTDVWAIQNGYVSVTRLRPNFMQVDSEGRGLDVGLVDATKEEEREGVTTGTDADVKLGRISNEDAWEEGREVGKRWRL